MEKDIKVQDVIARAVASCKPAMDWMPVGQDPVVLVVFPVPSVFESCEQLDVLGHFVQYVAFPALNEVYGCESWFDKEGSQCFFIDVDSNSRVWCCLWRIHGTVSGDFMAPFLQAFQLLQNCTQTRSHGETLASRRRSSQSRQAGLPH